MSRVRRKCAERDFKIKGTLRQNKFLCLMDRVNTRHSHTLSACARTLIGMRMQLRQVH